jgi:hypothetical protein
LDLVVVSKKMEIQESMNVLEDEALLKARARFVKIRSQTADTNAAMQVRVPPVRTHGFNGIAHPAAVGLGKKDEAAR